MSNKTENSENRRLRALDALTSHVSGFVHSQAGDIVLHSEFLSVSLTCCVKRRFGAMVYCVVFGCTTTNGCRSSLGSTLISEKYTDAIDVGLKALQMQFGERFSILEILFLRRRRLGP